ncbi:MAG: hypothetical protein AB1421_09830 [Pseudomonadota bacterium]
MFQPSGGLVYHLRAWAHQTRLWAPCHRQVRAWLADWLPDADHLVLVGPSGGYALDRAFLERFDRVSVLEPDALARLVFKRRFPHKGLEFRPDTALSSPGGFAWLARTFPDAAFLFCNLLGQTLVGQGASFDRNAWLAELVPALAGRAWASWHDVASTRRPPDSTDVFVQARANLDRVLAHYWHGGELLIQDHDCAALAPDLPRQYTHWSLRPGHYHLVEWVQGPGGTVGR